VIGQSQPSPLASELAGIFARMSGLLLSEQTVQASLSLITSLAQETLPGTLGAGVTLVGEGGHQTTSAASSRVVEDADRLQYELDEGPCLTAWSRSEVVRSGDLQAETRWPRWTAAVTPLGVRSCLSVPLVAGDEALGTVKVYSDRPAAYGIQDEHRLSMFSAQAAVLVANQQAYEQAARLSEELKATLRRRDMVAMARGVLMARHNVGEEGAFRMLVSLARQQTASIEQVADDLVRSTPRPRA
jgi:GAF domain-containing protein